MHHDAMKPASFLNRIHLDGYLLSALFALMTMGLFVLYSAGGGDIALLKRQVIRLGAAFGVMFLVAQIPLAFLQRWVVPLYVICCGLLVAVLLFGTIGKGMASFMISDG